MVFQQVATGGWRLFDGWSSVLRIVVHAVVVYLVIASGPI